MIGYGGTELTRWTRERVRERNIVGVRASTTRYFLADPNAARELPATSVPRVVSRERDAFSGQGHVKRPMHTSNRINKSESGIIMRKHDTTLFNCDRLTYIT